MTSHNFPTTEEELENKFQEEIQLDSKWDKLNFEQEKKETKTFSLSNSKIKQKTTIKSKKKHKSAKGTKKVYKIKTANNYDFEENNSPLAFESSNIHDEPAFVDENPDSEEERELKRKEEEEKRQEDLRLEKEREEKKRKENEELSRNRKRLKEEHERERKEEERQKKKVEAEKKKILEESSKKTPNQEEKEESVQKEEKPKSASLIKTNSFIPDSRPATKRAEEDEIEIENLSLEDIEEPEEKPVKESPKTKKNENSKKAENKGLNKDKKAEKHTLPSELPKREYLKELFEEQSADIVNSKKTIALNNNMAVTYKPSFDKLNKTLQFPENKDKSEEEIIKLSEEALAKVDDRSFEDFANLVENTEVSFEELKASPLSVFQPTKLSHLLLNQKSSDKLTSSYPFTRQPRTDGNSFYRCLLLGLIEVILFQGNGEFQIHKLIYNFSKVVHSELWNKQKTDLMLVFRYLLENLNEIDSEELYSNFLKMIVLKPELDLVSL